MDSEKLIDKIPDIYFDWYARLLPGIIALTIYFYAGNKAPDTSAAFLLIYAAISYTAGHIAQPLSSLCVAGLQKLVCSKEKTYETAKLNPALSGPANKISKAHAESVGMLSTSFLVAAVAFHLHNWEPIIWALIIYFFLAALERAWARKRKIEALNVALLHNK